MDLIYYFNNEQYIFYIGYEEEEEVAKKIIKDLVKCDKKIVDKFYNMIILDSDLLDKFLEERIEDVKEYFEELAHEEYEEMRY